jgi:PAT family beta-lactamase induction signal transducer AmpG
MLVFSTLSAWLRQAGVERSTIGMLAWVGIAYTLKFLWAPVVDRVRLPLLGRWLGQRRSWMLLAQAGIAAGLASVATSDPAQSVGHIALLTLLIAFCSATQDICIDAWRIESAPAEQQGAMASAYQFGYLLALKFVASAGALLIAAEYGWHASYGTMAALVAIGIATTLAVREPARWSTGSRAAHTGPRPGARRAAGCWARSSARSPTSSRASACSSASSSSASSACIG